MEIFKNKPKKKTHDRISTFQYVWGKPDFTPEQFLNQADLARYEL